MRSGQFVRTSRLIDYSPHTLVDKGEKGRVVCDEDGLVIVHLLRPHPGLMEWGNNVTLTWEDSEALVPCLPPIRVVGPALSAIGTLAAAGVCVVLLLPGPTRAIRMDRQAIERAMIGGARTVERIIYQDGRIYYHRTRYAEGSVVGVVTSSRELTPDEVPAEEEAIKLRQQKE